jgi:hypothetical protein
MTVTRDLRAARNIDFRPVLELVYKGAPVSLAGATASLEVRLYGRAAGAPLASSVPILSDTPHETDPTLRVLTAEPVILRSALNAFPTGLNQPEIGEADVFFYEMKLTYADAKQDSLWTGKFILEPGVDRT